MNRFNIKRVAKRKKEEALYEAAVEEIERGHKRPGLWAKALALSAGNDETAKSLYLTLVVQRMKDEEVERETERMQVARERQRIERRKDPFLGGRLPVAIAICIFSIVLWILALLAGF